MALENVVVLDADLHVKRHRRLAAELKNLIEFRGFETVILDFSRTLNCFPDAVLPIIALVVKYRNEGVRFKLVLPRSEMQRRLFLNCNWAALIDPKEFPKSTFQHDLNLAATNYTDHDQQFAFVKQTIDRILRVTKHLDRSHLRGLEWSLNEISDNVLMHASSPTGGVGQLSIRPNSRELEFVICDAGVGIPASLRSAKDPTWNDLRALEEATREGVTRGVGQGNGLFGSLEVATRSGGAFSINSGFAHLSGARTGTRLAETHVEAFPGTSVTCAISYARPFALEEALKFKGRSHTPVDFMELDYEGFEADSIIVTIINETISVGSRRSGYELRNKIYNIARIGEGARVVLDLTGLPVLSSSFADEAFGKLIAQYGVEAFLSRFRMVGVDRVNREIIFRSVQQRLSVSEESYLEQ